MLSLSPVIYRGKNSIVHAPFTIRSLFVRQPPGNDGLGRSNSAPAMKEHQTWPVLLGMVMRTTPYPTRKSQSPAYPRSPEFLSVREMELVDVFNMDEGLGGGKGVTEDC
jgi:hypothetical protein